jgi:hypothetical protein
MSWHPGDLVSDTDLTAYERTILTQHAASDWQSRRQKTLEDWLWPILRSRGLAPERLRTRYVADSVLGSTSSSFTDYTSAASNGSASVIPLATVLATETDYLAIGSKQQFRGVSVRMLDNVTAVSSTMTLELWQDTWTDTTESDGTQVSGNGKPFSKGGAITWTVPGEWVLRTLSASAPLYWARIRLSAVPTSAEIVQLSCIRRSVLCAPATLRTLATIFREAPQQQDGPWLEKAQWYENQAELALNRALPLVGGEFDTSVPPDDVVDADEQEQTTDQAGSPFRWERM